MAAVGELYSLLQQAYEIYTAGKDRLEKAASNPALADQLDALFKRLLKELAQLTAKFDNNNLNLPDADLDFFNVRIGELRQNLKETCESLTKKTKKLKKRFYRFTRAITTSDYLSKLETSARRADELLREITAISVNATLISQHAEDVKADVKAALVDHTETVTKAVAASSESRNEPDVFRPAFDVPDNPPHVVLDFQSTSISQQGSAQPLTIEGKLKSVVLRSDGFQSIGAIGSAIGSVVVAVGTEGMSGVGKSCAVRGLGKDADVRKRFRDGIYYISLGKDATEVDVVQEIAKIIKASGGARVAREVLEAKHVDVAVSRAKQWFAGKCVLLLIDDAWEENDSGRDVVSRLSGVVDREEGSRVVFTTRDIRMGLRSELLHFSTRGADVSRGILLRSAGLGEEDVVAVKDSVQAVLNLCGGLPMALAIAGSTIKVELALHLRSGSMSGEVRGEYLAEVWGRYVSELERHPKYLLRDTVDNDAYENLSSAFLALLSMLDKNMIGILSFKPLMSFSEMYRALMVLQRQGWMPVSAVELLWDTKDEHETMRIVKGLVNANMGQLEYRMVSGKRTAGISLHDLHLSFARDLCRELGESEKWHRKLLDGCLPCVSKDGKRDHSVDGTTSVLCRDWWKDEVFTDEYIRNNLSRHLLGSGLGRELHSLLRNPKWAAKRLCVYEILGLERDFEMLIEWLKREGDPDAQEGSEEWWLRMIAGAARLSSSYVSQNRDEVWFQLYARLVELSEESDVIRKYTADIEWCAEKPWVKVTGCLPGPGGALQIIALCHGAVRWISVDDGGKVIACGGKFQHEMFVNTFIGGHLENSVLCSVRDSCSSAASNGRSSATPDAMGAVWAVCCMRDGSRAVTGHEDGAVQLWNAKTGEPVGDALRGHGAEVTCVAFSADGKRLASGARDKTVWVWDAETGEPVGDALRGHSAEVRCVAFSVDGKRLASGSKDETVRVWDAETREPVGDALRGHTWIVLCVAFSADGKRLASGSYDGTVRVWDAETGEPVGDALGHGSQQVTCVAFAANGKRLASGSWDKTVRVWDAETGEPVGDALRGHSRDVICVAISADGKRVASGSLDMTVRVWDVETGEPVGDALHGHSKYVKCVAISADGKRVASGSWDKTVRVWDVDTGDCLRTADNWCRGDMKRLRFLLREEGAASAAAEQREECRVRFGDNSLAYGSADDSSVLATLEANVEEWNYSEVTRRIVVHSGRGVDFLELVV